MPLRFYAAAGGVFLVTVAALAWFWSEVPAI